MTTLRYNPIHSAPMFHCHPRNLLSRKQMETKGQTKHRSIPVDILETEGSISVKADMPGVDKKDVSIDLTSGVLTITGTRQVDQDIKDKDYLKKEIIAGTLKRSFTLSDRVNQEQITASMENGVLTVEIPKSEKIKPRQITVN